MTRAANPVGYFVHHQGRGHAERAAAIANAMTGDREIVLFCAREDIFPELADHVSIIKIPSLFEPDAANSPALDAYSLPDTLHCAPLGWRTVTQAIAIITQWFAKREPGLFITDVSAELGQLARIASVPHMCVLQHGDRDDAGHMAAYRGAVALLAPYAKALEQGDRLSWMRERTIYAPGIGVDVSKILDRTIARKRLGLGDDVELVVVVGGGGGTGLPSAPLTLGARAEPDSQWVTLGTMQTEWHETPPENLRHLGWVDNPEDWISAADRVVSSCGNTTVHMIAAAGKPWIVVPEWRYFAEQMRKAEALDNAGVAAFARTWPASAADWRHLWEAARALDADTQRAILQGNVATETAALIEQLLARLWTPKITAIPQKAALV
ncbi:MAG: glycosyltransferase [Alteraurantiacibacter sp.]